MKTPLQDLLSPAAQGTAVAVNLEISGLRKTFAGTTALAGVDLIIRAGEVHALLGENGSGKSTLIKILSGFHKPDTGEVRIGGELLPFQNPAASHRLGARFVHQDLGLVGDPSIASNPFLCSSFPSRFGTIGKKTLRSMTSTALSVAGLEHLDPDTRVARLTPALRTGVAVARALLPDADAAARVLVLDEPTATLPDNEVTRLLDTVRAVADQGVAIVYVTHRIDEIFDLAHGVSVLRDGHKVAERPVAGLTRPELVALLVGDEFERVAAGAERVESAPGEPVLLVEDLVTDRLHRVSFSVQSHHVTGVAGITGSGREEILGAVFGATPRESGAVVVHGARVQPGKTRKAMRAGVAYVPSERKTLGSFLNLSARENLTLLDFTPFKQRYAINRKLERNEVRGWFKRLSVRPAAGDEMPFSNFSGGNQQRIVLAKWLRCEPSVLLLDEPTQGVDLAAKHDIHQQLMQAARDGAAVVVSCSDPDELAALCDRVLVLRRGRLVSDLRGQDISPERIAHLTHDNGVGS